MLWDIDNTLLYTGGAGSLGMRRAFEDLYGVEDSDGVVIAAAFTHADLAHMVGATRQWVTISLKRMQEKRIVLTKRSQIVVCQPNILEEMRGQASD